MEPYYPVNDDRNNALYQQYRDYAHQQGALFSDEATVALRGKPTEGAIIFGGRLAEYKYYDMAPIIEMVMKIFGKIS